MVVCVSNKNSSVTKTRFLNLNKRRLYLFMSIQITVIISTCDPYVGRIAVS